MDEKIICRVLTGPTGSGKTEISLNLAERHGLEIACMDSMQVYRGMDIGTAKPTSEERQRIPHHLLDICDPQEAFSVSMYRDLAEKLIREKWEREGKELLFVGGTGLYLSALTQPMGMGSVPADDGLRSELRELAEREGGKEKLHELLKHLDPETAQRLPLNDVRRTIRAIEVSRATGIPFSRQPVREEATGIEWKIAATDLPREILYDRINRRAGQMIEKGLKEEVMGLLESGVSPETQSMQAIGYKEMILHLEGEWSLDKALEEIRKGTRHYAKRQETYLRREEGVRRFSPLEKDAAEQAWEILQ